MRKINYFAVTTILFLLVVSGLFITGGNNAFEPESIQPQLISAIGKLYDVYLLPENFLYEGASEGWGWIGEGVSTAGATLLGQVNITIEFWNIGAQGNNIYNMTEQKEFFIQQGIDPSTMYYGFGTVRFKTAYEGEYFSGSDIYNSSGYRLGNFSGGPEGFIEPDWLSGDNWKEQWRLINGNYILIEFKSNSSMPPPAAAEIPISNYKAFFNEQSISEPAEKELEKEPAVIEGELKAPTIQLILKGPFESGGNQNTFIVEAVVTGNPQPTVTFSRDDSAGGMGKYKAMINMAPASEFTVSATATNSEGSASSQVNISTRKNLAIKLEIMSGPDYVSRVTCYYTVKIIIEGSPLPDEYKFEMDGSTFMYSAEVEGARKGEVEGTKYDATFKLPVGLSGVNKKCEDMNVTATAVNKTDIKNKASASIVLQWSPPPEGMFGSSYDYLEIKSVKGKFQMKREKERLPGGGGFLDAENPKWEEYKGGGMLWIGDEIKTAGEPLIIEFLEDGSKFMLAPNSWMKITEGGIEIKGGEGNFKITKTKDGIKTIKNSFLSNFSLSTITGTSFVMDVRNNQTLLKVLDGTVEIFSTKAGISGSVSAGEAINSSEAGLSAKAAFSVDEEKLFWEHLEKEGTYYERENILSSSSSGSLPAYGIVLIILILLLCIALAAAIFVLKKYRYF
jgi:hypothetical protein